MEFEDTRFIIGIDLGTTNSAVSYVDLSRTAPGQLNVDIFSIPQLTDRSEVGRLSTLPSFLYIPGKYDMSETAVRLPWPTRNNNFVGAYARDQGVRVPARLVSSAKSWLCHGRVDRKARILPWGAEDAEDLIKVSPVEASAACLEHVRLAWNSQMEDEDDFLENQEVIITVPASFDEVARDLTVESARLAGIHRFTLLEEPLAAFYSWLMQHETRWQDMVRPDDLIFICDVGGGTTDFTLITLKQTSDGAKFERIAVGDHLILGGDNIDIALAGMLEKRMNSTLPTDRWKTLCNQCRHGKEDILDGRCDTKRITLVGQGRQLIAGTQVAELHRDDVEDVVLGIFFPNPDDDPPAPASESGHSAFGLPYEKDLGITRHIKKFLFRHNTSVANRLGADKGAPDHVLFNGGTLKPDIIKKRIVQTIAARTDGRAGAPPEIMDNRFPDLAVAMGASYYGMVRIGHGVRVGSGSARGYYLGVSKKDAGGAKDAKKHAVCLVERGRQEGSKVSLENTFDVLANQPVEFDMYSSSFRSGDDCGDVVSVDDSLTGLPPIRTVIQFGQKSGRTKIPVHIEAEYTEVGTLALWCRSLSSSHRWQLQFDLRNADTPVDVQDDTVFEQSTLDDVRGIIGRAFSDRADPRPLETLTKDIRRLVGVRKDEWPLRLIRGITDELMENMDWRKTGPDHERRWLNLMGFCLRPGFGEGFDDHRMKMLWRIYGRGVIRDNQPQVRTEWWILWRRVSGGMNAGQQKQFIQDAAQWVLPGRPKPRKISPQEHIEIWMAAAAMERARVKDKIRWGRALLSDLKPGKHAVQQLWSLSRIGARELLYGSTDRVVSVEEVWPWIRHIMSVQWRHVGPAIGAVAQMARKTGDRTRDFDARRIGEITDWMLASGGSAASLKMLTEMVPIEKRERNMLFGDSLPTGLLLRED